MATIISLAQAKLHLRVTQSAEDSLIQAYIDAAEAYIQNFLNDPNYSQDPAITAAALLVIGDLYESREANSEMQIYENPSVMALLYPYRKCIGI